MDNHLHVPHRLNSARAAGWSDQDGCIGAFWEGQFRVALALDEEHRQATTTSIELNALPLGIMTVLERGFGGQKIVKTSHIE